MSNRYDNYVENMGASVCVNKMNGQMDSTSGIGHDHDPAKPGNGAPIPGTAITGAVASATNATTAANCSGNAATATLAEAAKLSTRFPACGVDLYSGTSQISMDWYKVAAYVPMGKQLKVGRVHGCITEHFHIQLGFSVSDIRWTSVGYSQIDEDANIVLGTGNNAMQVFTVFLKVHNNEAGQYRTPGDIATVEVIIE